MKKVFLLFILPFFAVVSSHAQTVSQDDVVFGSKNVEKRGDKIVIDVNMDLNSLYLRSQEMIIFTPELRANDGSKSYDFGPVIVSGGNRYKKIKRDISFRDVRFDPAPQAIVRRHNGRAQTVPLTVEAPYEEWMRNASLVVIKTPVFCNRQEGPQTTFTVIPRILPSLFQPQFELTYVMPQAEPVKQRSETHSAHLNFEVGRYVLLRDFKNNAATLDEVKRVISTIKDDPNLSVQKIVVTGFASPEGDFQRNMVLSENRARAFVKYLQENYHIAGNLFDINWKGEDWEGLRKAVAASSIQDRDEILSIIDNEQDIVRRKQRIESLSGGSTYRILLHEYYPPLRRNEYTISYVARPFSVEEAAELIRTRPQHLSLNEIFLVANTYPKGSKEFKDIFSIAVRMYPQDPVARLNSATADIESGALDAGIQKLMDIPMPEAWNNIGVAYARKQQYDKAEIGRAHV